ncbi:hypothetical protein X975_19735, partial [Stegodyphus mimosarum]
MPAGITINADCYCKTLKNFRHVIQKRGMFAKEVRFHQDNARPKIAHVITNLINNGILDGILSHTLSTAQT